MAKAWIALEFISKKELRLAEKFLGYKAVDDFVILGREQALELAKYLEEKGITVLPLN